MVIFFYKPVSRVAPTSLSGLILFHTYSEVITVIFFHPQEQMDCVMAASPWFVQVSQLAS